jgi:hypothetical protein
MRIRSAFVPGKDTMSFGESKSPLTHFDTSARVYGQPSDASTRHCDFHASMGARSPFASKHSAAK